MAEVGEDDLVAVGQVGEELLGRVLGRGGEVETAADQERLHVRCLDMGVLVVGRVGRPCVQEASAAEEEFRSGVADNRGAVVFA